MNKISIAILSLIAVFSACTDSVKTKSGIEINYIVKNNAGALIDNSILNYNMRYENANGYELFNTDTRGGAISIQYSDSTWKTMGLLYEALSACEVGDSISFELPAKDLYVNTFKIGLPDSIPEDSNITFNVGLESSMTMDEFQAVQKEKYDKEMAERQEEAEAQIGIDAEILNKYLEDNNIEALTSESGIRYVITQPGSGENAEAGQKVTAHYSGTLLDGTPFDSSKDRGPYSFTLGKGEVIRGWDEGFALLNKGAKATLYIPSNLAYGAQARSAIIKENAILVFEVELVDIK